MYIIYIVFCICTRDQCTTVHVFIILCICEYCVLSVIIANTPVVLLAPLGALSRRSHRDNRQPIRRPRIGLSVENQSIVI